MDSPGESQRCHSPTAAVAGTGEGALASKAGVSLDYGVGSRWPLAAGLSSLLGDAVPLPLEDSLSALLPG